MKRSLLALALIATCVVANADNRYGWYAGGGLTLINTGVDSGDDTNISFSALEALGGYKYNDYIGGEVRVGVGIIDDDGSIGGTTIDYSLNHYESIYYRIESVNQVAKAYALIGATNMSVQADTSSAESSSTDSGLSWGLGIGFAINPKSNFNFEYRSIISTDDNKFTSFGINYDYRF